MSVASGRWNQRINRRQNQTLRKETLMRLSHALILVALLLAAPLSAHAQDEEATIPWISFNYGGGSYAMSKVNEDLQLMGQQTGLPYDEITSGLGFDIALGLDVGRIFRLGLHFQRMQAESSFTDGVATLDYRYPASAVYMGLAALRPLGDRAKYGLELAAGLTLSGGEVELSGAGLADSKSDLGGTGPFLAARALLDFQITKLLDLTTSVGYRSSAIAMPRPTRCLLTASPSRTTMVSPSPWTTRDSRRRPGSASISFGTRPRIQ
jgi:hypothetical protein